MERHWPLCEGPLPFRQITYFQADYHEFICSHATFEWLSGGGVTHADERPVRFQIMDEMIGGFNVIVKMWIVASTVEDAWVQPAHRVHVS